MDNTGIERRKEIRYPLEARVTLRKKDGETIGAMAVDISSSGMRLRLDDGCRLEVNEEVVVEVELPDNPNRSFSSWGVGRIAHLGGGGAGIQLFGGQFDPGLPTGTGVDCAPGFDNEL